MGRGSRKGKCFEKKDRGKESNVFNGVVFKSCKVLFYSLEDTDKAEESSLSKMKAGFNLIGIEYQDEKKPKFVGTVEYKKKNIRFQNRQLKIHKDAGKQPKHLHFDEDGNLILQPETVMLENVHS